MPKEVDAITKVDDYILWIIPKLEKFPRSHSFDNLMLAAKNAQKGKRKSEEVEWNFKAENPFYLYHIFKYGKVLYEK